MDNGWFNQGAMLELYCKNSYDKEYCPYHFNNTQMYTNSNLVSKCIDLAKKDGWVMEQDEKGNQLCLCPSCAKKIEKVKYEGQRLWLKEQLN